MSEMILLCMYMLRLQDVLMRPHVVDDAKFSTIDLEDCL